MSRVSIPVVLFAAIFSLPFSAASQDDPIRIDFSGSTAEENGVTVMGAGFGEYPTPHITFGSIPTDNAFEGATDGYGAYIIAEPGEGVMIFGPIIQTQGSALVRCSVRTNAQYAAIVIATIDQGPDVFVATNTPNNGSLFVNQYKRLSTFCLPGKGSFQPLLQVLNTSETEQLIVMLDNFEIYLIDPDQFYSGNFLDGDENDPEMISVTPDKTTPTPSLIPEWFLYAGSYGILITGEDSGSGEIFIDNQGNISGKAYSNNMQVSFDISGLINQEGEIEINYSLDGFGFGIGLGTMISADLGGGVWKNLRDGSTGSWICVKNITIPLNLPYHAMPLNMAHIPAGIFMMGSPPGEKDREDDEGPVHQVTLTKPFYIGKYEVTQAQWQAVMGSNPSYYIGPNKPVGDVTWYDAAKFCNRLSEIQGLQQVYTESGDWPVDWSANGFRLPTEAEWEYACRAGTPTAFYWGDDSSYSQIGEYAWYEENSDWKTHEVGTKLPNAWGLFDMSGNQKEWCQDWYGDYSSDSQIDPTGAVSGSARVRRGGRYAYPARSCRSASRGGGDPGGWADAIGFRVALSRTE